MVVLHHEFGVRRKDGGEETRTSTLISYGSFETYTAMAKTVGLPAAMATEMILRGESDGILWLFEMGLGRVDD